jgi:hypothetical protein
MTGCCRAPTLTCSPSPPGPASGRLSDHAGQPHARDHGGQPYDWMEPVCEARRLPFCPLW